MTKEIKLTDKPYGDFYQIIYSLQKDNEIRVYTNCNPHQDKKGKYYEISFQDMINEIEAKHNDKVSHFIMIAEFGLSGKVYRYNNYGENELLECGETRGYA